MLSKKNSISNFHQKVDVSAKIDWIQEEALSDTERCGSAVVESNRRLGFTVYRGNKTKGSLLEKGLIKVVSLSTKGGRIKILRLTDKGKKLANKLGYKYKNLPKNVSVKHEYWKKQVANMYRLTGYKVKEEVPIEIGSVDLVAPKKGIDSR